MSSKVAPARVARHAGMRCHQAEVSSWNPVVHVTVDPEWTHPYLAHALEKGGFAVTDVDSGTRLFASERALDAAAWLATEPKLAVKSGVSTLVWEPKRGLVELDASGDVTWDRRGDRLALFTPDPTGQGEIDRCKDCLRPVRFSSVFDIATGRELESDEFLPGGRRYGLTDFSIFDFEKNEARPFPQGPNHPWGSSRWNGDGKIVKGTQRWTTTISLETGRVEAWVERDLHANLPWGKQAGTSVDGMKPPRRPFTAAGLMFATLSPSGRFVVGGGEPPGAVLRVSDGAWLRLLVVETKERPYSVLIDEAGRYAGDDEAARHLSYATGTSLRDVTLANGLDVAGRFRKPDAIRAFFRQ